MTATPSPLTLPREALPTLPVVDTDYVQFFRSPRYRWWKSLVGLALVGVAWFGVNIVAGLVGFVVDGGATGLDADGSLLIGPWFFVMNNLALAAGIPVVMAAAWLVIGQRPRWLSSVVGGIRWGWLARAGLVILPVWLVLDGITYVLTPTQLGWNDHSLMMIVAVLVTTPLQAAGEEYLFRGFLTRAVGAWIKPEWPAVIVGGVVSSLVFMSLHGAGDPWLNSFYLVFGLCAVWLTWRTGGLEASIALHVINNVLGEATLPFGDFSSMFNRQAGTGDASVLVTMGALIAITAALDLLARRGGVVVRSAPGRPELEAAWARMRGFVI